MLVWQYVDPRFGNQYILRFCSIKLEKILNFRLERFIMKTLQPIIAETIPFKCCDSAKLTSQFHQSPLNGI